MSAIGYLSGDASAPNTQGHALIVHICNDLGLWGRGFVLAISARWPQCKRQYQNAFKSGAPLKLGEVQFIDVAENMTVANLIGQHGIRTSSAHHLPPPIRYPAVEQGLMTLAKYALHRDSSVHI